MSERGEKRVGKREGERGRKGLYMNVLCHVCIIHVYM